MKKLFLVLITILATVVVCEAHAGGHGAGPVRTWRLAKSGALERGSFLFARDGVMRIEDESGNVKSIAIAELSDEDRSLVETEISRVRKLNQSFNTRLKANTSKSSSFAAFAAAGGLLIGILLLKRWGVSFARVTAILLALFGILAVRAWQQEAQTSRPSIAAAFDPYFPNVRTRWDSKYLYVDSNGIPDHQMMKGITSWQQQVPVPQPYVADNAWSIPLHPVLAAQPISAKTALFTGAIALAVNGIPIFNALNNRGVDSHSIGELDEYGGHCGRADDYHYHYAPLHIVQKVGAANPIGFALDGYPLYGLTEADGSPVTGLDQFNGHFDSNNNYHYHSTLTYPYINGGLRGEVTVSNDQIVPQAQSFPPRPATSPLPGATLNGVVSTGANSWTLTYTLNSQTYRVDYSYDNAGHFTYSFTDPSGANRVENYTRKAAVATVSAANYTNTVVAPESIVAAFGSQLASASGGAPSLPLPTSLNGAQVHVIDAAGVDRLAPLLFASPGQINYQIPSGTSAGVASLCFSLNGKMVGFGTVTVAPIMPGLFTATADGKGYAAANIQRINGTNSAFEDVVRYDTATSKYVAIPIDFGTRGDDLYLVLYGTGIRNNTGLVNVRASVGGVSCDVVYAGPHCCYAGVDQVSIRLPQSLAGRGDVDVILTVDGTSANTIRVNFKSIALVSWSMKGLPDTGQTSHFSVSAGDDSDYQRNVPSFSNNGDGTINDLVTGLQWQQADGGEMLWSAAASYCTALSLGGHADWRAPSVKELFSIQYHQNLNPALNTTFFTKTAAEYWWASDLRPDDSTRAWATNAGGGAGPHPVSETISAGGSKRYHVRCVRSTGQGLSLTSFLSDNGNGTVTDNRTGLVWQKTESSTLMTWEEAITYAKGLSTGGFTDWRVPNIKELVSINEETRVSPSINTSYFAVPASNLFWSSTTLINQVVQAWSVDFTLGISSYNPKTDKLRVRCVRG